MSVVICITLVINNYTSCINTTCAYNVPNKMMHTTFIYSHATF